MVSRKWQVTSAFAGVCVVVVGCGVAVLLVDRIPNAGYLTRDATAVAGVPWWTGGLSKFTNLCWAAAASVNVMAALGSGPAWRRPLLLLGALCAVLALDDTLLVHEVASRILGVHELVLLAAYALAGLILAWWFASVWRTPVGAAFFVGAAMLGVSVAVDALSDSQFLLEDSAKLVGVLAWCFCGVWAYSDLSSRRSPDLSTASPRASTEATH